MLAPWIETQPRTVPLWQQPPSYTRSFNRRRVQRQSARSNGAVFLIQLVTPSVVIFVSRGPGGMAQRALSRAHRTLTSRQCAMVVDSQRPKEASSDRLMLVDGSWLLHASFYATYGANLCDENGELNGAVTGFLWPLLKIREKLKPSHFAVMLDEKGSSDARKKSCPGYKSHRTFPKELIGQFAKARDACEALELKVESSKHYEADDLIYTYAKDAADDECDVGIMSGDKDLTQAASFRISIHNNTLDPAVRMTPHDVKARWGVTPKQMVDFLALVGDSADCIPGVPGIGKVRAADLLKQYETLDKVIEAARAGNLNVAGIGPKSLSMLQEYGVQALDMRKVIQLRRIPKKKKSLWQDFKEPDDEGWREHMQDFCKKERFHRLADWLHRTEQNCSPSAGKIKGACKKSK